VFEQHFGLTTTPFRKDIPALGLFPVRLHQDVLRRLAYVLAQCQIACLCGETGTGKSTLLRAFVAQQSPARYRFLTLAHPPRAARDLYTDLLRELGAELPWSTADARARVRDLLLSLAQAGRTPVVIVDEAQDIPSALLEELRLLTAFELDGQPVLALILSGHPELAHHVHRRGLEALAQRVGAWCTLVGLDRDEVGRYLQHHLELAGCARPLFTPEATDAIFQATKGVPRAVGRLAATCLQLAANQDHDQVDAVLVDAATTDWD
jgi:general secretion pathway protein A